MLVAVVNQPKDDANASKMRFNAQSSACAKRKVLLNKYQK